MSKKTVDKLTSKLEELEDLSQQFPELDELRERIDELKDRAEVAIREHPLVAVGLAVVVGYMIGRLFSGSDD
jgi:ElaB/YqjD/DUF883 family membrane-anchored ribosome-binding protein